MKVRKFLFAGALLVIALFSVNSVMAQTLPTDKVTVNLKFKPFMSIKVDPNQKTVNFLYETEQDYRSGVAAQSFTEHLTVFSSGGFEVKLSTNDVNFTSNNNNTTIPVSSVSVKASANGHPTDTYTAESVGVFHNLSSTVPFIKSTKGGIDLKFDVEYDDLGFDPATFINGYNPDKKDVEGYTVFETTLTYTITSI